uniref:Rod shape-determining protein MreD n=1 Tax=Thermorudis peleae TaxID=1382356 RepID=A0A831X9C9_9BACT
MKRLLFALLLVGTATVQVTLLPRANPLEVGPDLVLGLVLVSSSLGGVAAGMIWAALAGFALDFLTLEPLGSHGLGLLLVAVIGGLAHRRLFRSDLVSPMGLVILATLASHLVAVALQWALGTRPPIDVVLRVAGLTALLNVAVVPLVYGAIVALERSGMRRAPSR